MLLMHEPFGSPVVPATGHLDFVSHKLGGQLQNLFVANLVIFDIVAILIQCLWIYLS